MTTETGGPAFPQPNMIDDGELIECGDTGMTLRDYFAAKAMAICPLHHLADKSEWCYAIADAMLKARSA